MARVNKCKICNRTEGVEWVGTNHNLCRDCCDERTRAIEIQRLNDPRSIRAREAAAQLIAIGIAMDPGGLR